MKKLKLTLIGILFALLNAMAQPPSPAYSIWYEYGDATFLKNSFTNEDNLNAYVVNLPAVGSGSNTGYQKIIQYYVPKPPPALSVNSHSKRSNVKGWQTGNDVTTLSNDLEIMSSTSDFISSDTVILAMHYDKLNYQEAVKVGFFYNSNGNRSFEAIINPLNQISIIEEPSLPGQSIDQVRMHNQETPSIASSTILNAVRTPLGDNYQNGIIFNLKPLPTGQLSSNIFVTLLTKELIEIDDNENFQLVFFDGKNNILKSENIDITNHSKLKSHDPNYEIVKPSCVLASKANEFIAHYDIHFQNIGKGPADSVMTYTFLPTGYSVNDIVDWSTISSGIQNWKIGGISNNDAFDLAVSTNSSGSMLQLKFTRRDEHRVPMADVLTNPARSEIEVLVGTFGMDNPLNDDRTVGEFQFDLKLKAPPVVPTELVSHTEIKFDTNDLVNTNEAVLRIRDCCKCKEQQSNNGNGSTKPCCWKSKFLKWLFCEKC